MKAHEYEAMFNAELTHWWYRNLSNEVIYWTAKALAADATAPRKKLLDLGCGTGGTLRRLQERFDNITFFGLDYYSRAVNFARQRTAGALLQGDVKHLPFAQKTFEVIVCLDVLYTQEAYPGFQSALDQIYELLTEKGTLILQLPAFDFLKSQHDINVNGAHRFTAGEIRQSLRRAGFRRCKIYYRYNLLFGVAWLVRKFFRHSTNESQVVTPPPMLNSLLYSYFACESWLNKRLPLPLGLSVFAVAQR